ncbi:MAG: hypothetical protein LWX56_11490 [Ignavibacteria bacterium]|nr:hypothetical protein [Ignavibacteria bacterium]
MGTKIKVQGKGKVNSINTTKRGNIIHNKEKAYNPWLTGSFYILLFLIIMATLLTANSIIAWYMWPVVIISLLLIFSTIGAFQLRADEKLQEKNFLQLMGLTFKYIPLLRARGK